MSQIRELLRQAQQAELAGDLTRAIEILKSARDWYRHNNSPELSLRMERQISRLADRVNAAKPPLKEVEAPGSSAGVTALSPLLYTSRSLAVEGVALPSQEPMYAQPAIGRGSKRAKAVAGRAGSSMESSAPAVEAGAAGLVGASSRWCSFCLQPESAVGACWEGAGGATLCRTCAERMVAEMANVRGSAATAAPSLSVPVVQHSPVAYPDMWPWQQRWSDRISALAGRSWLIVAPQGFGLRRVLNGFSKAEGLISAEIAAVIIQGLAKKSTARSKNSKAGSTSKRAVSSADALSGLDSLGVQAVGTVDGSGRKAVVIAVPQTSFHKLHQWLLDQPLDATWATGLHAIVSLTPPTAAVVRGAAQPYFGKVGASVRAQWELMTNSMEELNNSFAATPFLARWTQLMRAVNSERM